MDADKNIIKLNGLLKLVSEQKQMKVFNKYIDGAELTNCHGNVSTMLRDLKRSSSIDDLHYSHPRNEYDLKSSSDYSSEALSSLESKLI